MRTRALSIALAAFALVALTASDAAARSRHERVKIAPIKKAGKIVGLKLTLLLRPQDRGHDRVKIGLAPPGGIAKAGKTGNFRDYAGGKKGFLVHQWKEVTKLQTGRNKEVTLEVLYSKAKNLVPGEKVEVVTAWRNGAKATYYHVWGMKSGISGTVKSYKVPGTKPKAPAAASTTTTRRKKPKPAASTTTTRRKKPKPAATTTATRRKKPKPAATTTATRRKKPKPAASTTATRRKKPKPAASTTTTRRKKPKPAASTTTTRRKKPKPKPTTTATRRKKPKPAASTRQNLQAASASTSTRTRARASSSRSASTRTRATRTRARSRARSSRVR